MDIDNITLLDVIDKRTLQTLQDAFAEATGMAALATDKTGAVTQLSCPTDFCMNMTRKSRVGCERCNQCDLRGGEESSRTGRPSVYYCHAGLVDFAAPIIVNGRHIGSLIGGQVLTDEPDDEKFRAIAAEIGVNPEQYIAAMHKVKIVPKKTVDAAANLLYQMANSLSEVGYQRLVSMNETHSKDEIIDKVNEHFATIDENMMQVTAKINTLSENFSHIKDSANTSAKAVENTDSIVKAIENASTQLTLIGFNASIEAKRAGAAGAGFNVIAQEVRTLADKNTKQAGEVESTLNEIKKSISGINGKITAVYSDVEKTEQVIENLKALLDETTKLVKSIK